MKWGKLKIDNLIIVQLRWHFGAAEGYPPKEEKGGLGEWTKRLVGRKPTDLIDANELKGLGELWYPFAFSFDMARMSLLGSIDKYAWGRPDRTVY